MDKTTLERKKSALATILNMNDIDVPKFRMDVTKSGNVRWLGRNFMVRNSEHPLAATVMDLLKQLLKTSQ